MAISTRSEIHYLANDTWDHNQTNVTKAKIIVRMRQRNAISKASSENQKSPDFDRQMEIITKKISHILNRCLKIAKAVNTYNHQALTPAKKKQWQSEVSQLQTRHNQAENEAADLIQSDAYVQNSSASSMTTLIDTLAKSQLALTILQNELAPTNRFGCVVM